MGAPSGDLQAIPIQYGDLDCKKCISEEPLRDIFRILHFRRSKIVQVTGSSRGESVPEFCTGDKWSFCLTAGTLVPANQERR